MKIRDTSKTTSGSPLKKASRTSATASSEAAAAYRATAIDRPVDKMEIAGIPEAELTPKVKEALFSLMNEVQQLREELAETKGKLDELTQLADRDPMIDIYNRRAFVRELDRMLAMVERYDFKACLVFIDLNGLKKINDELGHVAGDAALRHVGNVLTAHTRQTDTAGRLGGDEFGVLLTQVDKAVAEQKARELSMIISSSPAEWKGGSLPVSVSYGVVEISKGLSVDQAMESADSAMYKAKRAR